MAPEIAGRAWQHDQRGRSASSGDDPEQQAQGPTRPEVRHEQAPKAVRSEAVEPHGHDVLRAGSTTSPALSDRKDVNAYSAASHDELQRPDVHELKLAPASCRIRPSTEFRNQGLWPGRSPAERI